VPVSPELTAVDDGRLSRSQTKVCPRPVQDCRPSLGSGISNLRNEPPRHLARSLRRRVRWLEPATNDPNSNVRKLIRWLSGAASDRSF
jgi:hypothetical protein